MPELIIARGYRFCNRWTGSRKKAIMVQENRH
jgi:hypothetical protein